MKISFVFLFESLPDKAQRPSVSITRQKIEEFVKVKKNLENQLIACNGNKGLLGTFVVFRSDIVNFDPAINFTYKKAKKREVAFRVLEIITFLGIYKGEPEKNSELAKKEVENYQKLKEYIPITGNFGRQTFTVLLKGK